MRPVIALLLLALAAGCSGSPSATRPTVPGFTASASPSAGAARPVPKSCGGIATQSEVSDLLNVAVSGQTLPVVGVPEPKIGRTARLDCYYGVPEGKPVAAAVLTIGLASYTDEAAARRRMSSTVESERDAGAKASDVPVGADRGILLSGAKRILVAVRGRVTVVITVVKDLIPDEQAGTLLGSLADRALTGR